MKKNYIYFFAAVSILLLAYLQLQAQEISNKNFPQARISNGIIEAVFYLPDTADGYYRGARFDWAGVMPELNYEGHTFFGQWFEKYDPYIHDAIMGPVNDFSPIGYDEVKPGGKYMKIGIGTLLRPDDQIYTFSKQAKLVNPGKWKIKSKTDQIMFTHTLRDEPCSYAYTKTIKLLRGRPVMVMTHTLENTGKSTIETNVYNHNFFVIDNQPTGPDFKVEFPFILSGSFGRGADKAGFRDNKVVFFEQLLSGESVHGGNIKGFGDTASDYNIIVSNKKTGAGVRITGDRPLSRLVFWASHKVLSPEPYTNIRIEPKEKFTWTITYEFVAP
jgi:hypothetical protein